MIVTHNGITGHFKMTDFTPPMIQLLARTRGLGEVTEILQTAIVMHRNWEADNHAWAVRMDDGSIKVLSTNSGGLCELSAVDISDKISETQSSVNQLEILLEHAIKGR